MIHAFKKCYSGIVRNEARRSEIYKEDYFSISPVINVR